MAETGTWGLIGPGGVGGELQQQLADAQTAERLGLHTMPSFVIRSSGVYGPDGQAIGRRLGDVPDLPETIFIAVPTTDDGTVAKGYITEVLSRGSNVVTAEKGAIANFYPELKRVSHNFDCLGFSASVGGGTRMIPELRTYCSDPGNVSQIHVSLNGTLAAIFGDMAPPSGSGMSFDAAVKRAVELGYAEPGAKSPLDVIRGEAQGDIPKKVGILFNALGLSSKFFEWQKLRFTLSDAQIRQAVQQADKRRFIISIYPEHALSAGQQADIVGGFDVAHDGWRIAGGFQDITTNPHLASFAAANGPTNGFVVALGEHGSHGTYALSGPGAGVGPTVGSMLHDYVRMSR